MLLLDTNAFQLSDQLASQLVETDVWISVDQYKRGVILRL